MKLSIIVGQRIHPFFYFDTQTRTRKDNIS